MLPPAGIVTVLWMPPVPVAENPLVPVVPTAVKLSLVIAAGKVSLTLAPTASLGPKFDTTIV